jgi:hypothetical protein
LHFARAFDVDLGEQLLDVGIRSLLCTAVSHRWPYKAPPSRTGSSSCTFPLNACTERCRPELSRSEAPTASYTAVCIRQPWTDTQQPATPAGRRALPGLVAPPVPSCRWRLGNSFFDGVLGRFSVWRMNRPRV